MYVRKDVDVHRAYNMSESGFHKAVVNGKSLHRTQPYFSSIPVRGSTAIG
jgi:hypothetical protein